MLAPNPRLVPAVARSGSPSLLPERGKLGGFDFPIDLFIGLAHRSGLVLLRIRFGFWRMRLARRHSRWATAKKSIEQPLTDLGDGADRAKPQHAHAAAGSGASAFQLYPRC